MSKDIKNKFEKLTDAKLNDALEDDNINEYETAYMKKNEEDSEDMEEQLETARTARTAANTARTARTAADAASEEAAPNSRDEDIIEVNIPQNEEKEKRVRKKKETTKEKKPNVEKKRPGRPRTTAPKQDIPRKGIASVPTDEDSIMEFLYDSPILLKKIITFFKSVAATHIQILFRLNDIIIYSQDHHKQSTIYIKIQGSKTNHYYCKSILDIGVRVKDLESILNKVDKDYSSIILLSTLENNQKSITIILENDIQIDETHTIEIVGQYQHLDNEAEFEDENYMISFDWPGKYFRKTINDIKTIAVQLNIVQEDKNSPLEICYVSANKKIHSRHIVKKPSKINLVSNLPDHASFRIGMKVENIKPISSAHIADEIKILIDENKKLMTKSFIDNKTIEMKTLTNIIDIRPV